MVTGYTYKDGELELDIIRVDKPQGRWLVVGTTIHAPGFTIYRFIKTLPPRTKLTRMTNERAGFRHYQILSEMTGEIP